MIKLRKYLKPYLYGVFMAILLLFGQALCELNLPNYMSNIVNVGIQQNGIEHAAPDAISPNGFKLVTTFMSEDQKKLVDESYKLVSVNDKNEDETVYKSLYPDAESELYVKKGVDEQTQDRLDDAFGTAVWTFLNVVRDTFAEHGQTGTDMSVNQASDIDLASLYKLQPMLDMLPGEVVGVALEKTAAMDPSMLRQSGIQLARVFYQELGVDVGAKQTAYILRVGLIMLAIALLGGVATVLVNLISSKISAAVARNLRKDMFDKIESFTNAEFDKFSTASLITRCTNDVTHIQMFLMMGIRMVCFAPIMGIGGVIMAVNKSVSMSWIIAVAAILLVGLMMTITSIAMPKFKIIQKLVDRLNLISRENLSGMMVIRAFGTQEYEKSRFDSANSDLTATNLFINRVMILMHPVMTLIMNGTTLIIIWVGAHQIADSAMRVGDMMAFMQYAMHIIMSFLMVSMMFIFIPRAAISAGRIAEVLEIKNTITNPVNPKNFDESKRGLVEFRNVCFRYENAQENALSDITFTAKPGETTAIIGSTGSGKSTIANLILRFYDASSGQVLVNGVDVREVTQKDIRESIGYVPQKASLLSGTIESNLKYGKEDATDQELKVAAEVAQAMEFITAKPDGFESDIAQDGSNVSGGQKQRLSIARALVKKPDIFIFDDSFSALDFRTDSALRKALKEHTGGSTVIVIAQRVGTIMNAEQIIVLDEGKIVGRGTHKELIKSCPQYFEIASSQLSQEELA